MGDAKAKTPQATPTQPAPAPEVRASPRIRGPQRRDRAPLPIPDGHVRLRGLTKTAVGWCDVTYDVPEAVAAKYIVHTKQPDTFGRTIARRYAVMALEAGRR